MPNYKFECKKCKKEYYDLCAHDATGKYPKVKCPHCKSKSKTQLITTCSFNFSDPVGTDRWNSDSQGHDYRYNYNKPNVQKQRALAEMVSHMGADPYGSTVEQDLNLDTGIHDPETRPGLS